MKAAFLLLFLKPIPERDVITREFFKTGTIRNDGFMNMGSRDLIVFRDAAFVFIPRNAFIAIILCHKKTPPFFGSHFFN
jgi:hypothetical protein